MTSRPPKSKTNPWQSFATSFNGRLTLLQIGANLAGAGIVTFYFMFIEPGPVVRRIGIDLAVVGAMFVVLVTMVVLSRTFSNSIIAPVRRLEKAMNRVEAGDFSAAVPVDTNDELGALAHISIK